MANTNLKWGSCGNPIIVPGQRTFKGLFAFGGTNPIAHAYPARARVTKGCRQSVRDSELRVENDGTKPFSGEDPIAGVQTRVWAPQCMKRRNKANSAQEPPTTV